jgi:hypothetical protein
MLSGLGTSAARASAAIPAALIVIFNGLLWLLGLFCGPGRRKYVTALSQQAMTTVGTLFHRCCSSSSRKNGVRSSLRPGDRLLAK